MEPLALTACGMATGVGLSAAATCAALRCALDGFRETRFMVDGEWLLGCPVPLPDGVRGSGRLMQLALLALEDCVASLPDPRTLTASTPLLLCLSDVPRIPVGGLRDDEFLAELRSLAGLAVDAKAAQRVLRVGRMGAPRAIEQARRLLAEGHRTVIVLGVDTLLTAEAIAQYEKQGRLLTDTSMDGFIPGEAAAAIALSSSAAAQGQPGLVCLGMGFGQEEAPQGSGKPLRAVGLTQAIKSAMADAGCTYADVDYRMTDINGEQFAFKDAALALLRTMRVRKEEMDLWHPADCVGDVGAALGPLLLGAALFAAKKDYAPGPTVLCHFASEGPDRAAMIWRYQRDCHG